MDQLLFDRARPALDMVQAFCGALACHLLLLAQECRSLQPLEVMLQQDLGGMRFDTEEAAIALGNDSGYGLGSGVSTRDLVRASYGLQPTV
ncbi:hypothetical protein ACN2XU_20230 [Primorskyibacter sp. 2E107]|uniref:hypothetical protein n=1 Tax=Primorskyibacter sp. 2E107 TaxID=3403458 RepID=UPI003AF6D418